MNRIMLCIPKVISKISLIFILFLLPTLGRAQGLGMADGWISNCFQKVNFDENRNIKMLSGSSIFYGSTTGTALPYFAVRQYTASGLVYVAQPGTPHPHYNTAGEEIFIYENSGQSIELMGNGSVIIDFYSYGTTFHSELSITVDFISAAEAFKIQPHNQSCFTYNDFEISNDIVNLEGFCGFIGSMEVELPAGVSNRMGLPEPYTMNVSSGSNYTIPIDETECTNTNYACPSEVACGCIDFNVNLEIYPCNAYDPNCSMITVSKPVRICCRCGIPDDGNFPSTGRNTASAALNAGNSELTIFPNPNQSGKLQVSASGNPVKSIKIYTVDGRLVKNINVKEAASQVSVDISNLQPGIYQVKVLDNANAVSNKKLIVQ